MIGGLIIGFVLGGASGAIVVFRALPKRFKHHIDYKERWLSAMQLLGTEGKLTEEQIKQAIQADQTPKTIRPAASSSTANVSRATLEALHGMFSGDRREAEIARAKQGLPPLDDLEGMFSGDISAVMRARAKYGTQ